jgi:protein-tyrosine-phosphatase
VPEAPATAAREPTAVLFACNLNRVRSPMAAALLGRLAGGRIYVDSCGLTRGPDSLGDPEGGMQVDPLAAAVMAEIGCDISGSQVKTFDDLEDGSFDLVISLSPEAQDRAAELARGRAVQTECWPIQDPTIEEGSREVRLEAYRAVRDTLADRIRQRFLG